MFSNYVKVAVRNLLKQKGFTFINVFGLAIGIAACLLILHFVIHEYRHDRFHTHADRIFRITNERTLNGTTEHLATTPLVLHDRLVEDIAEVEHVARLLREMTPVLAYEDQQYTEEHFFFADANLFEIFDIDLISGDPATALDQPNSLVITTDAAARYFGSADPLGQQLTYRNWGQSYTFEITAVARPMPAHSHWQFDFLAPFESPQNAWDQMHGNDWYYVGGWTYVLLPDAAIAERVEAQLPGLIERHMPEALREATTLTLQPLTDIHLRSHLGNELEPNGRLAYVFVFATIAVLILLIACINFMNLTTARSTNRSLEVGLRKTLGARRKELIGQFMGESTLISLLATGLAVLLAEAFRPVFNNLIGESLHLDYLGTPWLLLLLLGGALFVGVLAGSYPALYLSSFSPIHALKGGSSGTGAATFRQGLVVSQFVVSIVLLISVGLILKQVAYMKNQDLGFELSEIAFMPAGGGMTTFEPFRQALAQSPYVVDVQGGGSVPSSSTARPIDWRLFRPSERSADERFQMNSTTVHAGYADLFGLHIQQGRFFDDAFSTDTRAIVLNEAAVRAFGWTKDTLNKQVEMFNMLGNSSGLFTVIGVVADYHYTSLHHPIEPMVFFTNGPEGWYSSYILKLQTTDIPSAIGDLQTIWDTTFPDQPFTISFLDQDAQSLYQQDEQLSRIIGYFTGLAMLVACLGLFGLAAFMAEQRTKEIGIRKTLGASVFNVVVLLSKDFLLLIAIALALAIPLAYAAMQQWLDTFAYRIAIGLDVFALAGGLTLVLALLTVGYQAIKAAQTNPVDTLRYE